MINDVLQQAAGNAVAVGPLVLLEGLRTERPRDIVQARALSVDDKRAILAAWASDLYAVDSRPALRFLAGTSEPVSIDEVQAALRELDRRYGY